MFAHLSTFYRCRWVYIFDQFFATIEAYLEKCSDANKLNAQKAIDYVQYLRDRRDQFQKEKIG